MQGHSWWSPWAEDKKLGERKPKCLGSAKQNIKEEQAAQRENTRDLEQSSLSLQLSADQHVPVRKLYKTQKRKGHKT